MNFKINFQKHNFSLITIIGFSGSLLLVLAVFSNFNQFAFDVFFNSDTLYLPSIYKDIFQEHNLLKDWQLNPSPNFFPDMLLYFIFMFFTNNFIISSFIFAIIQYAIILYILTKIFKEILPNQSKNWHSLIYLFMSIFLLEFFFLTTDFNYTFYLISNSYHTGSFVMALCSFYISLNYYKKPTNKLLIILFTLSLLCVLSDRLFVVLFCVPMIISMLFLTTKKNLKSSLFFIVTVIASIFLGIKLIKVLEDINLFHFDKPHKMFAFDDIQSSWKIYKEQISTYMKEIGFKSLSIYLFALSFLSLIFLFFYTRKSENKSIELFIIYSGVFSICVLLAPIINGSYTGWDVLRYNIYPFYLSGIIITVFLAIIIKKQKHLEIGKYIALVFSICIFVISLHFINKKGLNSYFTYYPKTVKLIDELVGQKGLHCGVGNYWEAKKTTLFSKKGVKIYSVFENLSVYDHVTNQKWFFGKNEFNFVLLNGFKDTSEYQKHILTHQLISNSKDLILVKTNTFTFKKDEKGCLPVNQ